MIPVDRAARALPSFFIHFNRTLAANPVINLLLLQRYIMRGYQGCQIFLYTIYQNEGKHTK
jgi:hypothetical protein